jgi:hypothetical protein
MYCPKCGYLMDALDKECPRCKNLENHQQPSPPSPIPPPAAAHQATPTRQPISAGKIIGIVALCLFGFCVLTGIIASIGGSGGSSDQATTTRREGSSTESTPAASKAWVEVTRLEGNGNKRSAPFTLGRGKKRLNYTVSNDDMAVCMIYVVKDGTSLETSGGFPEVSCNTPGTADTTFLAKAAGTYYLDVSAANCQWTVVVEEEK